MSTIMTSAIASASAATSVLQSPRKILGSSQTAAAEIRQLVATIATAELLAPSQRLWLSSGHPGDSPVLDNRGGEFNAVAYAWGERRVRLSELLAHLLSVGTFLVIVAPPSEQSELFRTQLVEAAGGSSARAVHRLRWVMPGPIAPLGWVGDGYALDGGLKFNDSGIILAEEGITFEAGDSLMGSTHVRFTQAYGGAS